MSEIRKDPQKKTNEEKQRDMLRSGQFIAGNVINKKPGYTYRFACPRNSHGLQRRKYMGYDVVRKEGSDCEIVLGTEEPKNGEPLTFHGQYLMRIENSKLEEYQQYGADGRSGTNRTEELCRQYLGRSFEDEKAPVPPEVEQAMDSFGRGGVRVSRTARVDSDI